MNANCLLQPSLTVQNIYLFIHNSTEARDDHQSARENAQQQQQQSDDYEYDYEYNYDNDVDAELARTDAGQITRCNHHEEEKNKHSIQSRQVAALVGRPGRWMLTCSK